MIPTTASLAAAIVAPVRHPAVRLTVDWYGCGEIDDHPEDTLTSQLGAVTIDRALAGDLPDEVSVVEGSAAASLSADLTVGDPTWENDHAARWFSPADYYGPAEATTALARAVTADIGFQTPKGVEYVRRFTGSTRTVGVSSRRRTAKLAALDYRERFRTAIQVPGVLTRDVGLNASWLISNVCHQAKVPPSPPPPVDGRTVRVWLPGHGSMQPFTASLVSLRRRTLSGGTGTLDSLYQPGPFYLAPILFWYDATYNDTVTGNIGFADYRDTAGSLVGMEIIRLEMWVMPGWASTTPTTPMGITVLDPGAAENENTARFFLGLTPTGALTYTATSRSTGAVIASATGPTVPVDGKWHFIGVQIDISQDTATFTLDSAAPTSVYTGSTPYLPIYCQYSTFTAWWPFAELQVSSDPPSAAPWIGQTPFTPAAILDRSALDLDAVTERETREAWDLLKDIAAAEQAVIWCDEQGIFRYRTRDRLTSRDALTVRRTLTALDSITDLDAEVSIDRVRNIVSVPYTPVWMDTAVRSWVWDTKDVYEVPAGGSVEIWAAPEQPLADVDTDGYPVTEYPNFPNTYASLSKTADGAQPTYDNITVQVTAWTVGSLCVRVTNTNTFSVWTANPNAGYPTIGVAGLAARVDRPISVRDQSPDSIDRYGPQPYTVPTNPWVQRRDAAVTLAVTLVADLADPHLTITDLAIVADPRLQLGDLVRLIDANGIVLDGDYWITAIRDEFADTYRQRIGARRAPQLLRWGIGRWGMTVWGPKP